MMKFSDLPDYERGFADGWADAFDAAGLVAMDGREADPLRDRMRETCMMAMAFTLLGVRPPEAE